tara:strand:- start:172 stop:510 length:339 start_codon:yes stop_codon:yes gene_type:complete
MKKIMMLSVLPALLLSTTVGAEPYWANKPVQCADANSVVEQSMLIGEKPTIFFEGASMQPNGNGQLSRFVISTNNKTRTWTLIEFPKDSSQGCILGSGIGSINIISNNGINI